MIQSDTDPWGNICVALTDGPQRFAGKWHLLASGGACGRGINSAHSFNCCICVFWEWIVWAQYILNALLFREQSVCCEYEEKVKSQTMAGIVMADPKEKSMELGITCRTGKWENGTNWSKREKQGLSRYVGLQRNQTG